MKWPTLATSASLIVLSVNALAKDITLQPVAQNLETKACYVAATEGLTAARTLVSEHGVNFNTFSRSLTCNGMRIDRFAVKYRSQASSEIQEFQPTKIALVAKNSNAASQLCLDAIVMGENEARNKHDLYGPIICNGKDLPRFVNSYQDQEVEIRNSAE